MIQASTVMERTFSEHKGPSLHTLQNPPDDKNRTYFFSAWFSDNAFYHIFVLLLQDNNICNPDGTS